MQSEQASAENQARQPVAHTTSSRSAALRFVILIGVVSLFADMTYEGAWGFSTARLWGW